MEVGSGKSVRVFGPNSQQMTKQHCLGPLRLLSANLFRLLSSLQRTLFSCQVGDCDALHLLSHRPFAGVQEGVPRSIAQTAHNRRYNFCYYRQSGMADGQASKSPFQRRLLDTLCSELLLQPTSCHAVNKALTYNAHPAC